MEKKIRKSTIIFTGAELIAGAGVDLILTGIAKAVVPPSFGLPGLVQKLCIKTATLGISLVIADAIDNVLKTTADEIVEAYNQALDEELKTR